VVNFYGWEKGGMKKLKRKLKMKVTIEALGAYIKSLADAIDGKLENDQKDLIGLFDNFSKATIKLSRKSQKATLEIKVELEPEPEGQTNRSALQRVEKKPAPGNPQKEVPPEPKADQAGPNIRKPKYKNLKKRMKKSFKDITQSISDSRLPARSDLDSFLYDSELMVSYPGHGDEYYTDYQKACQSLKNAYERLDFAGFKHEHGEIKKLMRDCHDRYK
jgi:XXXCH domain-containing protein